MASLSSKAEEVLERLRRIEAYVTGQPAVATPKAHRAHVSLQETLKAAQASVTTTRTVTLAAAVEGLMTTMDRPKFFIEHSHCQMCRVLQGSPCETEYLRFVTCVQHAGPNDDENVQMCIPYTNAAFRCMARNHESYFKAKLDVLLAEGRTEVPVVGPTAAATPKVD